MWKCNSVKLLRLYHSGSFVSAVHVWFPCKRWNGIQFHIELQALGFPPSLDKIYPRLTKRYIHFWAIEVIISPCFCWCLDTLFPFPSSCPTVFGNPPFGIIHHTPPSHLCLSTNWFLKSRKFHVLLLAMSFSRWHIPYIFLLWIWVSVEVSCSKKITASRVMPAQPLVIITEGKNLSF